MRPARPHRGRARRRRAAAGQPRQPGDLADQGRQRGDRRRSAARAGGTLRVYNWTEYLYKKVVKDFEKKYAKYDVKVQISTYGNMDEAVAKLRAGQVAFDVLVPTYDYLGKLIQGDFLRPVRLAGGPGTLGL